MALSGSTSHLLEGKHLSYTQIESKQYDKENLFAHITEKPRDKGTLYEASSNVSRTSQKPCSSISLRQLHPKAGSTPTPKMAAHSSWIHILSFFVCGRESYFVSAFPEKLL